MYESAQLTSAALVPLLHCNALMAVCKRTAKRRGQEEARARCISNVGSWMRQVRRALMSSVRAQIGIQSVGPLSCAVTAVEDDVEVGAVCDSFIHNSMIFLEYQLRRASAAPRGYRRIKVDTEGPVPGLDLFLCPTAIHQ